MEPKIGERYYQLLVELCKEEKRITRPRVKPVEILPSDMRIEFPRDLREDYEIGTRFRCDVVVAQKHYPDGRQKGEPYLVANKNSITFVESPNSRVSVWAFLKPDSISGRAYEYHYVENFMQEAEDEFQKLRNQLLENDVQQAESKNQKILRDKMIREYALLRSEGICEACEKTAPFLSLNDKPYLEAHHILSLSQGGTHDPQNIAAICPNCHARVTHGKDSEEYNSMILENILAKERELSS